MADGRLRVFVPEPLPETAFEMLRSMADIEQGSSERACSERELADQVARSDALIITSRDRITRTVIEAGSRLKIITKTGAKPDNVDFAAAQAQKVLVTWTPGANAVSVAEYAVSIALLLAKRVLANNHHVLNGGWRNYGLLGTELYDKTAGLIGFGAIGCEVARRLRAFGMKLIAHDPEVTPTKMLQEGAVGTDLQQTISSADFLFLHCTLNDQTRNMIDEKALRSMKATAILVNTARGGLVDEAALVRALEQGWIAGAGIDVFAREPVDRANRLLTLPNVVATPHVAAFTQEAIRRETHWAVEDVALVLSGGRPRHWQAPA